MNFNKKVINKKDWKEFKKWCTKEEKIFFKNISFYSSLFSINSKKKIDKYIIEFYLFNHFKLNNKYDIHFPKWIKESKSDDLTMTLKNLFKNRFDNKDFSVTNEFLSFEKLFVFLKELNIYLKSNEKNVDQEYKLYKKYAMFTNDLVKKNYSNFNLWIIFLNENIYVHKKGFK